MTSATVVGLAVPDEIPLVPTTKRPSLQTRFPSHDMMTRSAFAPSNGISATAVVVVGTATVQVNFRGPIGGGGGGGGGGGDGGAERHVTFTASRFGCPTHGSPNVFTDTGTVHC